MSAQSQAQRGKYTRSAIKSMIRWKAGSWVSLGALARNARVTVRTAKWHAKELARLHPDKVQEANGMYRWVGDL